MHSIPDRFARAIRVIVKVEHGQLKMHDGTNLPLLKEGSVAELVFSPFSLKDPAFIPPLTREWMIEFFPKDTTLYARVKTDQIDEPLATHRIRPSRKADHGDPLVPFQLVEPLRLKVRAGKRGQLDDCTCHVPALDKSFGSINEAYTAISMAFEPSRRSHTGNVFLCVYYKDGDILRNLNWQRGVKECETPPPLSSVKS